MEVSVLTHSVLSGSDTCDLLELSAEVFRVMVTALISDITYGICREHELVLCELDPVVDNIVHAGIPESILVKEVEVCRTDIELIGHIGYIPVLLGVEHDLSSDLKELLSVRSGLGSRDVL